MSILNPNIVEETNDHAEIFGKVGKESDLHKSISDEDYEYVRAVYWPIYKTYKEKFLKCCMGNDLDLINKRVDDELNNVGFTRFKPFADIKDVQILKEYIISLIYPASYSDMLEFLKRVLIGDLEFFCQINTCGGESCISILKKSGLGNTLISYTKENH